MTAITPARKLVHWDADSPGYSDIGSPSSQFSDDSIISTSSLQYVNSQLVAHGFASAPGISLDGVSKGDMDKAVKCLLDLLAQRMKDMSRAEQLTTELRTLRYDHQRMVSLHHTAAESAANFEREVNTQKSRLGTTTKTLQQTELSLKHTTAELQRTRGALQTVRATHQAELKKRDKEVERMAEKWNKISDAQAKLGASASGLRFSGSANAAAVEPSGQVLGKGKNFLEVALEDAEKAREQLGKDNLGLRVMVLKAVNEVQSIASEMKRVLFDTSVDCEAPSPMTLFDLFPLSPPNFTTETLSSALNCLRDILATLSSPTASTSSSPVPQASVSSSELERMQEVIEKLKLELQGSQEQLTSQASETQAMFDRFVNDHKFAAGHPRTRQDGPNSTSADISVDLITVTARDEELGRLGTMRKQLEEERRKFTDAAIQLGKDRVNIEAERARLKEEKRAWQVEMMLAELPPTPIASGSGSERTAAASAVKFSPSKSRASSKKYPTKAFQISVGKAGSVTRKTTRVGVARRRSSSTVVLTSPSKTQRDAEPAFETEVIPPSISLSVPPLMSPSSSSGSLLPTSFALPPPSPRASLPATPALLISSAFIIPSDSNPSLLLPPTERTEPVFSNPSSAPPPASSSTPYTRPSSTSPLDPVPQTPQPSIRRPFPVAKPLATHMIHAYSPARPSPLSRILLLGNSPGSPNFDDEAPGGGLEALMEMDEQAADMLPGQNLLETELFPLIPQPAAPADPPSLSSSSDDEGGLTLAQQLGVSDSPPESPVGIPFERPESPLREKKVQSNITGNAKAAPGVKTTVKGRTLFPAPATTSVPSSKPRFSTAEKGKAKAKSGPPPIVKSARLVVSSSAAARKEKENDGHGGRVGTVSASTQASKPRAPVAVEKDSSVKTAATGKRLPSGSGRGGGGPRRVPLDSAEAPPVGRGRSRP